MPIPPPMFGKRTVWIAAFLLCPLLYGQSDQSSRGSQNDSSRNRPTGLSELAKDNLNRVAASSVQIREVLAKDAGLLVELKRWVAKEAADNGQIVEDSNLSDQAIFDRLDHDVAFRSIATRLLQRYGYLLPTTNPDSTYGKEQELVLKERARRLVQIESQEDTEALNPERNETQQVDRTATCNSQETDCGKPSVRKRQTERERENPQQNEMPAPETNPRLSPEIPRTLQTELSTDGLTPRDRSSEPQIEFASAATKSREVDPFSSSTLALPSFDSSSQANRSPYSERTNSRETVASNNIPRESGRTNWKRPTQLDHDADVNPVKMVRPANPYSDIPSLYDMYVQAAA